MEWAELRTEAFWILFWCVWTFVCLFLGWMRGMSTGRDIGYDQAMEQDMEEVWRLYGLYNEEMLSRTNPGPDRFAAPKFRRLILAMRKVRTLEDYR